MYVEVRIPNGEAAQFEEAAGRRLNGNLYVLSAWLDSPIESLEALPDALRELLAAPEMLAAANAVGDDMFGDFHHKVTAGQWALTRPHLRPVGAREVWECLRWMLTNPVVFYRDVQVPIVDKDVVRLANAFARWWLGARSDGRMPIASSWMLVAIDPDGLDGFGDGFFDHAFLAYRGTELRMLLQDGAD